MSYLSNYILDSFSVFSARFLSGRKNYDAWKKKAYSLKTVKIKNKKLAKELEDAAKNNAGFLTFAEYLQIDQFGNNGYHALHKAHGETQTHKNWPKALSLMCKEKGYTHIIEFGPGNGDFGAALLKEARRIGHTLSWSGIEIATPLQKQIRRRFKKEGLEKNLQGLYTTSNDISINKESVIVFSYSLDSIPPEMLVNTTSQPAMPNAVLGVTIKNGILSETILPPDILTQKGVSFSKGIYTDNHEYAFDVRSWVLSPGQRAFLPFSAFSTFIELVKKAPLNTLFVIIEELSHPTLPWEAKHLGIPKDVYAKIREQWDMEKMYKESGERLLYYPLYLHAFQLLLRSLQLDVLTQGVEQKIAHELLQKPWKFIESHYITYAFLIVKRQHAFKMPLPIMFAGQTKH